MSMLLSLNAGRLRRQVSQGRILRHRRAVALHQRLCHRLPQHGIRQEHGLQARQLAASLCVPQFRQGNVLRQRNGDARDFGRARQGTTSRLRGPYAGRAEARRRLFAELADVEAQERHQRHGRQRAGLVPGQLCAQPLLGHEDQQPGQEGPVRADGARSQSCTASTRGSGTATPIPAAAATASSSTTRS